MISQARWGGWLVGLILAIAQGPLHGCAVVSAAPYPMPAGGIRQERAVIIWDETKKIEHFIRQAEIVTTAPDLGFLVPTPHIPELVEADPQIFKLADEVAAPKKIPVLHFTTLGGIVGPLLAGPVFVSLGSQVSATFGAREWGVHVLGEKDVGGYHATILAADDAQGLASWLKANGYAWQPDDEAWLKPYIAAHWTITAFKLIKGVKPVPAPAQPAFLGADENLQTSAIRMSFATDHPFFPYSEPRRARTGEEARSEWRRLEVAILTRQRMQGAVADGTPWPGQLRFAGPSSPAPATTQRWLDLAKLPGAPGELPPPYLTCLRDDSHPRPGTADLYFSADPDPSPFRSIETDYQLPKQHRIIWGSTSGALGAILTTVLVPWCFITCGRRLYRIGCLPDKAVAEGKSMELGGRSAQLAEVATYLLGFYPGLFYFLMALIAMVSLPFGMTFWETCLMLPGCGLLAVASFSIFFCAARLTYYRKQAGVWAPTRTPARARFERWMGAGAIGAGVLFLVAVAGSIYNALTG